MRPLLLALALLMPATTLAARQSPTKDDVHAIRGATAPARPSTRKPPTWSEVHRQTRNRVDAAMGGARASRRTTTVRTALSPDVAKVLEAFERDKTHGMMMAVPRLRVPAGL